MDNNNTNRKFRRAKETSFMIMDAIIFDLLSPAAIKVYGQLRKLVSFTKQYDDIEVTVKSLAQKSGISERKTYDILNELEYEHYLIQRINIDTFRHGKTNIFMVSQTYGFFKNEQIYKSDYTPAKYAEGKMPVDNIGQVLNTPAESAVTTAKYAVPPAESAYLKKQESFQEFFQEKQNNKESVSVFSNEQNIKNHVLKTITNRGLQIAQEFIDQIVFYVGTKCTYSEMIKKINIALKKIREKKWNIPHGFQGITLQSIKNEEQEYQKQKQETYKQEAIAAKAIFKTVSDGEGLKSLGQLLSKMKADLDDKTNDRKRMQKCFV